MAEKPPNADGVMTLSDSDRSAIKTKLNTIQDAFVPTDDQPICDTFYLVSAYNKQNIGKEINGDTAESVFN